MAQAAAPKNSRILALASVAVVIGALYFAKQVLVPVALATMLSFVLAPLVTRLQRLHLGRVPAVIAVVLLVVGVIGVLGYIVVGQVGDLASKIPQYQANIEEKVTWVKRLTSGGNFEKASRAIENSIHNATTQPATTAPAVKSGDLPGAPTPATFNPSGQTSTPVPVSITAGPDGNGLDRLVGNLYSALSPILEPLATLFIVAILAIFVLIAREDVRDRVIRLIGQGQINITTQAMDEAATRISRYLIAQCIVNGAYGLTIGAGLWVIGALFGHSDPAFPNWLLWGMLTGLLRFVPYIGPWIGAAFPMILALAVYHGMSVPAAVVVMFIVVELITTNWVEPWLYGSSAGVSEVAILVAAVFWTWLWGLVGLLLSTPLTVIFVVAGKYVPQLEFLNILLGAQPALEPKYRLYQRLLAEDIEEAEELLTSYAADLPLVRLYDTVVLPALSLAENERHRDQLDEHKQALIRNEVRELVVDLGEMPAAQEGTKTELHVKGESGLSSNGKKPLEATVGENRPIAELETVQYERTVVCLPARDPADEIACVMLAQVLDRRGYRAEHVSVEKLASEYVQIVGEKQAQVVVVSALPPAAVTHARYIVKRLRASLPDLKIIVGLWTECGDVKKSRERLAAAGADLVVCSLEEAVEKLRQVVAPLLINDESVKKPALALA